MKFKNKGLAILGLITSVSVLSACSQNQAEQQLQPQQKDTENVQESEPNTPTASTQKEKNGEKVEKSNEDIMKEKIDEQSKKINELTSEVDYYKEFVSDLTATFTTEELNEFIDKEWSYKLSINDINFPSNGVLQLSNSNFDLVLSEERVPYSVLSEETSLKGKIAKGINNQVTITADKITPKKSETTEGVKSVVTYSFTNIPSETVIKVKITEELQKELKLNTQDLEIHVQ